MPAPTLTIAEVDQIRAIARRAVNALLPSRKVEIIAFGGKRYRAVRTSYPCGFQVQSADKRHLITEGTR